MDQLKVAVILPTRGDRPVLLANALRQLKAQTRQPNHLELVDFPPESEQKDITTRYRKGYENLRGKGFDVILLIEDDDWYHPEYIEIMLKAWLSHGKPQLFGINYTLYYNLVKRGYFFFIHSDRASAMATMLHADMEFPWPPDHDPYLDMHLWLKLREEQHLLTGKLFNPERHICIGMKHGTGLCGGGFHTNKLEAFEAHRRGVEDPRHDFLKQTLDAESYHFYSSYINNYYGCKKTKYANAKFALQDLDRIAAKSTRENRPIRPYLCHRCGSWHLTSQPFQKNKA